MFIDDPFLDSDPLSHMAALAERKAPLGGSGKPNRDQSIFAAVLFFWALTYLLFTARAQLGNTGPAVSGLRFVTTAAGAALVGAFLAQLSREAGARAQLIGRIVLLTVLGSVAMWAVRNLYSSFFPQPDTSVADNARWAMFWGGYCASFLALYLVALLPKGGSATQTLPPESYSTWPSTSEIASREALEALWAELSACAAADDAFLERVSSRIQARALRGDVKRAAEEIVGDLGRRRPARSRKRQPQS